MSDAAALILELPAAEPVKKARSGSANRKRRHLEQFRTDDAEHDALRTRLAESGSSLGAFVMKLAALDGMGRRPRIRRGRLRADVSALLEVCVHFSRANNNLNQLAHTGNAMMLFADEHGADRLAEIGWDIARGVKSLQAEFPAILAAIHAALGVGDDSEG